MVRCMKATSRRSTETYTTLTWLMPELLGREALYDRYKLNVQLREQEILEWGSAFRASRGIPACHPSRVGCVRSLNSYA